MADTLLVLGNGFDMLCGLKSSFPEYLDSDFYKPVLDRIIEVDKKYSEILDSSSGDYSIYDGFTIKFDDELCFWDLYYGLPHYYAFSKVRYWYDFETKLYQFISSIIDESNEFHDIKEVYRIKPLPSKNSDYKYKLILYKYLRSKTNEEFSGLFSLLFSDLKRYESRFGHYIINQQHSSADYISKATDVISKLVPEETGDTIKYINTFNYSDLSSISKDVWFINGDSDYPIFGVDLPFAKPTDEQYVFSKTYRRFELTNKADYFPRNKRYTKVIVCGHSLNRQDYSYFYSLLNLLGLDSNRNKNRKSYVIEFVYYKYKDKSSEMVRKETVSRVLDLLYQYNKDILREPHFRLVDILFATGAIKFREIMVS